MPVTHPGSALHQKTSSGWRSSTVVAVAWWLTMAPCPWTTPLAGPDVPEVYGRSAGVRADVCAGRM